MLLSHQNEHLEFQHFTETLSRMQNNLRTHLANELD